MRFIPVLLFGFALTLWSIPAFADCTDPAAVEGDQTYNLTYKTMMFCDGTNWNSMKAANAGLRNDCANDEILKWNGSGWICAANGACGGSSVWLNDGPEGPAEIYYSGGNVGIGTSDPTTKLHVLKNSGGQPTAVFQQTDNSPNLAITDASDGMRFEYNSAQNELRIQTANPDGTYGGSSIATFESTGNVGIGTFDPLHQLHVLNHIGLSSTGTAVHMAFEPDFSSANGANQSKFRFMTNGASDSTQGYKFSWRNDDNTPRIDALNFHKDGSVGIGTDAPSTGLKLDVAGKVGATEYCDQNGANCTAAASLGGGGGMPTGCQIGAGVLWTGSSWVCDNCTRQDGAFVGSFAYCWFKGNLGQSCTQVCSGKGGTYNSATATYAGSSGTNANCQAIASVLVPAANWAGTHSPSNQGCFVASNGLYRGTAATTAGALDGSYMRLCACTL